MYMGPLFRNHRIGFEFNSSLVPNISRPVALVYVSLMNTLLKILTLRNGGRQNNDNVNRGGCMCVFLCILLVRCRASQDSANLPEYI